MEHITQFTLNLLQAHYQQFQVYKEDKRQNTDKLLAALVKHAYHHVIFEYLTTYQFLITSQKAGRG